MLLATTTIEDFDRWMKVFTTTSAEKRKKHGSKGAVIFRDPNGRRMVHEEAERCIGSTKWNRRRRATGEDRAEDEAANE